MQGFVSLPVAKVQNAAEEARTAAVAAGQKAHDAIVTHIMGSVKRKPKGQWFRAPMPYLTREGAEEHFRELKKYGESWVLPKNLRATAEVWKDKHNRWAELIKACHCAEYGDMLLTVETAADLFPFYVTDK